MKTRQFIATAVVVVTATGISLVSAASVGAQSFGNGNNIFDRTAEILGVSSQELTDAFKQAQVEDIEEKIQSGDLDSEKGIEMIQRIQDSEEVMFMNGPRAHMHDLGMRYKDDVLTYLGISEEDFRSYMQDGQTLSDIAEDKNINIDDLKEFIKALHIDSIESNDNLSEEQKAERLENIDDMVEKIVNFNPPQRPLGFGPNKGE